MPYFDIDEAMKYASEKLAADREIDLSDQTPQQAIATLEQLLTEQRGQSAAIIIRFPPASESSGETLFQPVGRWLLEQRKNGRIRSLQNLLALGAGFYIEL